MAVCLISTCGGSPTRSDASRSTPVNCETVEGPPSRMPLTLRSNFCSDSVAFTTASVRNLRSGLSAANMSSG